MKAECQIGGNGALVPGAYLSPKLASTMTHGYVLRSNGQPGYRSSWHMHDCAMLLWPRSGRMKAAWADAEGGSNSRLPGDAQLSPSTALLLPAFVAHRTHSCTQAQRHGELYLPPDRLQGRVRYGALRLDDALAGLLNALFATSLVPESAGAVVEAIVGQLGFADSVCQAPAAESVTLGTRMLRCFGDALEWEQALPRVDDVARTLQVSTRQLQRACQQEFGASPIDIRRRLLASRARSLLLQGRTLAEVSQHLYFASSGHLNRLLRAIPS